MVCAEASVLITDKRQSEVLKISYGQETSSSKKTQISLPTKFANGRHHVQVPGRIWDGKESVLAALAAVTKTCSSAVGPADGARVVAALTDAADRKKLDFRQATP